MEHPTLRQTIPDVYVISRSKRIAILNYTNPPHLASLNKITRCFSVTYQLSASRQTDAAPVLKRLLFGLCGMRLETLWL